MRPLRAQGRYRTLGSKNRFDPPPKAAELAARMQAGNARTPAQSDALERYTGDDYLAINGALRGRKPETPAVRADIANIRQAMTEIPDNVVLYRTASVDAFGFPWQPTMTKEQAASLAGRTFHDPGFFSTSVNPRTNASVQMVIKAPAGTRGAYLHGVSRHGNEYEMLLNSGTHFKIDGFEAGDRPGDILLNLTVVGQDEHAA